VSASAASQFGGGDVFWLSDDFCAADVFAQVNPADGDPAVVGVRFPGGLSRAIQSRVVEAVDGMKGVYTVAARNFKAFNRIAQFEVIPR
jgi:hypothetical protein